MLYFRIPDSVGKDIEKACQSIYPLHDVYVRKVKMLKKPKFECKYFWGSLLGQNVVSPIKTAKYNGNNSTSFKNNSGEQLDYHSKM